MSSVLAWAVRARLLVIAGCVAVVGFGAATLRSAPVDALPEFMPPYAEIQTEALGLSAVEVEELITAPMEADLLNGVEGVDVIRSQSLPGLSSIVLVFEPGSDVYEQRQLVQERLTQAPALPHVSKPPTLLQPLSTMSRVLMVELSSTRLSRIQQSVLAHWVIRPQLMGVPGVANVAVWGMRDQQLQVQVDPERLRDRGVTLEQVVESAGNAQVVSPLTFLEASTPGTGGFIESPQQRLQVRHLIEKIAGPRALGSVPVAHTQGRLRITDVADVRVDHQPLIGDGLIDGGRGLVLVVEKFPGAGTVAVTEGVEDALEQLAPGLAGMRTDATAFRPAGYITGALDNLGLAAAVGGVLMVLALLACRQGWRSVLVAAVVVPLSVFGAVLVLVLLGQGLNALTLAGLAAAVTVVVDEAVVATDAARQAWRSRREAGDPRPTASVVTVAMAQVRRPLVYATLIALLVTLPVFALGGRPGAFFTPVAVAYAAAVLTAAVVAVTATPALASMLPRPSGPTGASRGPSRAVVGYRRLLERFGRGRGPALLTLGGCLVLAVVTLPFLSTSLVPSLRDRSVVVDLQGSPGTAAARTASVARGLMTDIERIPGVQDVGGHVGRAVTGDRLVNVSSATLWVGIADDADYDATLAGIRDAVAGVSDVDGDVSTYSDLRVRAVGALRDGDNPATGSDLDVLTGTGAPLVVRLYGADLRVLADQAARVRDVMADVDGVVAPTVERQATEDAVEIEVDLARAREKGLTPGHVRRAEATLLQGIQVGSVFEQQKVFDVVVLGGSTARNGVQGVRNLLIDTPDGGHVRLGEVADVRVVPSPSVIHRDAVARVLDVTADVSGRSVDKVAADVRDRLAGLTLPLEYHAEVVLASTAEEAGWLRVVGVAVAVLVAALLLLQAAFGGWRLAAVLLGLVLLAPTGGLLTGLVAGAEMSLGMVLALLAVLVLAVRTDVLLVARWQTLRARDPGEDRGELVRRGAGERLSPALATMAAVAALALPFAVLGGRPGLEVLHPMAWVLLGGLVTSAVLSLLVLPTVYADLPESWVSASPFPVQRLRPEEGAGKPPAGERPEGGVAGGQPAPTAQEPIR